MMNKKLVAIIPARGGSKRIPKKNIIDFFGKPLIAWTIEAAKKANIFDAIIVSTDCEKIAEISHQYGAEIPFLRTQHTDDVSPVSLATISTLKQLKSNFEMVIQLMPNCPLRSAKDIAQAFQNFEQAKANSQISCFKFGWMNPWWAVELDPDLKPKPLFNHSLKQRSQDLPDLYCPTGAIWISNVKTLINEETFYSSHHIFHPIDWKSAIDIDTFEDLEFAKATYPLKFPTSAFLKDK